MPGQTRQSRTPSRGSSSAGDRARSGGRGQQARRGPARPKAAPPAPVKSDLELALDAAADAAAASPITDATFASLGLPQKLVTALERRGMTAPFAIQTRSIPDALA